MKKECNFTIEELSLRSEKAKAAGIDNTPPEEVVNNLNNLINFLLQPLRDKYGKPIVVTSGYRCRALNELVGGAKNSDHLYGFAADIYGENIDGNLVLLMLLKDMRFKQVIWERDRWIHVSWQKGHNRGETLITDDGVHYRPMDIEKFVASRATNKRKKLHQQILDMLAEAAAEKEKK